MPDILITVQNKVARLTNAPFVVCGNSDYVVKFTFDAEFAAYTEKTMRVVFRDKGVIKHSDVLFTGTQCNLPPMYRVDCISIGVCAGNVISTTPVLVPCEYGDTAVHEDPPPDIYEQLLEYLENLGGGGGVVGEASLHAAGAFGGVAGKIWTPNLPYIQSSGTQGIRCDFTPSSTDVKYELKYADIEMPNDTSWHQVYGGFYNNMRPGGFGFCRNNYGGNMVICIGGGDSLPGIGFTKSGYHELTVQISGNDVTVTFDGMTFADTWAGSIACPVGLCCGASASGTMEMSTVKVYGFKIWEGGTLRRDFSPATVNGRAGFYDAVSETMFYSVTGTDFEYVPAETEE